MDVNEKGSHDEKGGIRTRANAEIGTLITQACGEHFFWPAALVDLRHV